MLIKAAACRRDLPFKAPELRLTPEQFSLVCEANPEAVLELSADGQLITMTPIGSETGARNQSLSLALGLAARHCSLPLKLFDSSSGCQGQVFRKKAHGIP